MTTDRPAPAPYFSRPGRLARVAPDLSELHGPTHGVVELPFRMFWQKDRTLDLDKPFMLQWMYEIVLREAIRLDELRDWLDGPTLVRMWRKLFLPKGVRRAWEDRHAELRNAT